MDDITLLLFYNNYIKMMRGLDKKAGNKNKGKGLISGGIVNKLEQISLMISLKLKEMEKRRWRKAPTQRKPMNHHRQINHC